jgi:outer membrane usher protein FimD/PapC
MEQYVAAAHASVSEVGFKVLNNRRVMIRVKRADNRALDKGLSIVDEKAIILSPAWMTGMFSLMRLSRFRHCMSWTTIITDCARLITS